MLRSLVGDLRSGSRDEEFLVSIVDEAHALINPEHVEGRGQHGFAVAFRPQAYHAMRCSRITVFLLDVEQGFRDQENTSIDDLRTWAKELGVEHFDTISLEGCQSVATALRNMSTRSRPCSVAKKLPLQKDMSGGL